MHDLDARTIRDAIQSPYGQPCIDAFLATLREVKQITVKMEDSSVVTVTSPVQGRALLTFLGWTPPTEGWGEDQDGTVARMQVNSPLCDVCADKLSASRGDPV